MSHSIRSIRSIVIVIIVLVSIGLSIPVSCTKTTDVTSGGSSTTREDVSDESPGEKKVFKEDDTEINVVAGEKFGIRLRENPSIGDNWMIVSDPDSSFVEFEDKSMKYDSDDPMPGSGGQVEFKFKAKKAGTSTTVTLFNCYRCGTNTSIAPENTQYAKRITYRITVS